MMKLTHSSMISIGLACTFAGVVFSAGMLYTNVQNTHAELVEFKTDTKEQFATLNEKIDKLVDLKVASARMTQSAN